MILTLYRCDSDGSTEAAGPQDSLSQTLRNWIMSLVLICSDPSSGTGQSWIQRNYSPTIIIHIYSSCPTTAHYCTLLKWIQFWSSSDPVLTTARGKSFLPLVVGRCVSVCPAGGAKVHLMVWHWSRWFLSQSWFSFPADWDRTSWISETRLCGSDRRLIEKIKQTDSLTLE